jgi:DNA-binding CsgD family transcriptional regulator
MIRAMARRLSSPVLVGRDDLVQQLLGTVHTATSGAPRHAVVGGEAGVGKSRLLAAVAELAARDSVRVLTGRCVAMGEAGLPFAPYTEIVRSLIAQEGAAAVNALAGRGAADLARLVPSLGSGTDAATPELWARTRLHEAVLDMLVRLAARGPVLVQLEDLHWADAGTLSATAYLLRAVHDAPINLMATYRSDDVTRNHPLKPWLAEVSRDAAVERIELRPLSAQETATLVQHILDHELAAAEVADIQRRSDGNPFFIEELLASRSASSVLPTTLREVLLARVDDLPASARHVIGVASVGGREVEHDMLTSVLDGGGHGWDDDLRELVEAGLLQPTRAIDQDDAYSFRHALLQEAVYDAILPTERRRLHRLWGEVMESHVGAAAPAADDLVSLAHHWREARDARALEASIAAGDAAMAGYAYAIASAQYEQALTIWDGADVPPTRGRRDDAIDHVALLERASRAAYLAGQHRRALALCRSALAEFGEGDPVRRTTLQVLLGRTLWVSGDYAASVDAYEEAVRGAPSDPPKVRAQALAGLGQVYMLHSRHEQARVLCEESIAAARAIGARDLEGHGLNTLGVVLSGLGEISAANASITEALAIALELGIPDDIGRAYVNKAEIEMWSGDPDQAIATSIAGLRATHDWGVSSSYGAWIAHGAVSYAYEAGRWDEAMGFLQKADRIVGSPESSEAYRAAYVTELLACRGAPEVDAVWESIRRSVAAAATWLSESGFLQAGLTHLSLAGRHDDAIETARDALDYLERLGTAFRAAEMCRVVAWAVADAGLAARRSGDVSRGAELDELMARAAKLAGSWRTRMSDPGDRLPPLLSLDEEQVLAESARLTDADDPERWAALAAGWMTVGRPFRVAVARWRQAQAAERAGDRPAAIDALREAHRIASELGAAPLLAHLEAMARRLRARSIPAPAGADGGNLAEPSAYGLTPREREVLAGVAAGRTNRQIAEALFISESTAGVHVSNILGKLGVSTRTEAARVALGQGLAGDEPAP